MLLIAFQHLKEQIEVPSRDHLSAHFDQTERALQREPIGLRVRCHKTTTKLSKSAGTTRHVGEPFRCQFDRG